MNPEEMKLIKIEVNIWAVEKMKLWKDNLIIMAKEKKDLLINSEVVLFMKENG
jgi:hypothetical protein